MAAILTAVLITGAVGTLAASGVGAATLPTPIDSCTTITSSGEYYLIRDISGSAEPCIRIRASGVTLDGRGHSVQGELAPGSVGILAQPWFTLSGLHYPSRITVVDVTVSGWDTGIAYRGVSGGSIRNTQVTKVHTGILLEAAFRQTTDVAVSGNRLTGVGSPRNTTDHGGITLKNAADNTLRSNTVINSEWGILLSGSDRNVLRGNDVSNNYAGGMRLTSSDANVLEDTRAVENAQGVVFVGSDANQLTRLTSASNTGSTALPSAGLRLAERSSANTVTDIEANDNEIGIALHDTGSNKLAGITAIRSRNVGIQLINSNSDTFEQVTVAETDGPYLDLRGGSGSYFSDLTLDRDQFRALEGHWVTIRPESPPPQAPAGYRIAGPPINASPLDDGAWLNATIDLADQDIEAGTEGAVGYWRYQAEDWTRVEAASFDPDTATLSANATEFGVLVPLIKLPPALRPPSDVTLVEGQRETLAVSFSDPGGTSWTVTVDDGTNSASTTVSFRRVGFDLVYPDDATHRLAIEVCDNVGLCDDATVSVTVENAPPIVTVNATDARPGEPVVLMGTVTDSGPADTHTAAIAWGDGNRETFPVAVRDGRGEFTASITYAAPGAYTIVVRVTDDDGGMDTAETTVSVATPTPSPTATPSPTPTSSPSPMATADSTTSAPVTTLSTAPPTTVSVEGHGFGFALALLAIVGVMLLRARRS